MQSQFESGVAKKLAVPPKIQSTYKNLEFLAETSSYKVYEAQTCDSDEKHIIRILDRTQRLMSNDYDLVATLFVKELLHLQFKYPGSVLTNTFEISEDGQQIACATLPYLPLSCQIDGRKNVFNPKDPQMVQRLISDALSDIDFLMKNMQIEKVTDMLGSLYFMKEKGGFFVGDWASMFQSGAYEHPIYTTPFKIPQQKERLNSQGLIGEIKSLASAILQMNKVDLKEIEILQRNKDASPKIYNAVIKATLEDCFTESQALQSLIHRMLSLNPQDISSLNELQIKGFGMEVSPKQGLEQEKQTKNEAKTDSTCKKSTRLTEEIAPTLLAWCTQISNKVRIIDLKTSILDFETKLNYATFDGAMISDSVNGWTHIKEIPNTKLLVSLHHNYFESANMEVFDVSKKGQARKIYSLGEVSGVNGSGAVSYNARRSILGAIPVTRRTSYHLFTINTSSRTEEMVKLNRKSKWNSKFNTQMNNCIPSFDFDPAGEIIAAVDSYGVCLLSNVNTNNNCSHLQAGTQQDGANRCKWSTNTGEALLYVKYDSNKLNILDVERNAPTFWNPIQLATKGTIFWIDTCQSNGNLLASAGSDNIIKIFDKRQAKIVQTFQDIHSDWISCVRWYPSGNMLASTSKDCTAKLSDFRTGKVLHSATTPDGNHAYSVCFI